MDNRITIYTNDNDRRAIHDLLVILDKRGVDVRGPRGDLSMSALFRHLVKQELERQTDNESIVKE